MPESQEGRLSRLILDGPPQPPAWLVRVVFCFIVVISLGLGIWHASVKPFWFDEILTVEVSSLPSAEMCWQALYEGCDGMPPGYYWINTLVARLPVEEHVRWRIPELLGWLMALTGVYLFAGTAGGQTAGLAAALLLALTNVSSYAWEARPYALLLGVVAIAAVCWQRGSRHWGWSVALAALLTVSTNLHYLAPLSVVCFALAEAAVNRASKRWRWGVWAAFAAAAVPTVAALPLLLKMRADFSAHFWSRPEAGGLPYYYGNLIGFPLDIGLVLLPFGFVCLLRAILREKSVSDLWQALVLACSLSLLPAIGLVLTMATQGGFNERYAMPMVIGFALALPLMLKWNPGGLPRAFTACLLLAFLVLAARDAAQLGAMPTARRSGESSAALVALRKSPQGPLVVTNALDFLPAWYYATPADRNRLYFVGDLPSAYRLGHTDGAIRLLLALRKFETVPVRTFDEFLPDRQDVVLFTRGHPILNWQTARMKELGWRLEPFGENSDGQLYRAYAPKPHS